MCNIIFAFLALSSDNEMFKLERKKNRFIT
jgi:hypothetical protein